jgi:DNA polymerase III delta prime subunit
MKGELMSHKNELTPSELRYACDPAIFDFTDTSALEPLDRVIGQERAVQAIDFGLNMKSPGYHIFVTGIEGTGKSTIVKDIVTKFAQNQPTPNDWSMVNNFRDEYRPRPIAVSPGQGIQFSRRMNRLVIDLKGELPKVFENKRFLDRQAEIQNKYSKQKEALIDELEKSARGKNLQINRTKTGFQAMPLKEGKLLTQEEFQALTDREQAKIKETVRVMHSDF